MPKYLMLIVEDEAAYAERRATTDLNDVMEQHRDFTAGRRGCRRRHDPRRRGAAADVRRRRTSAAPAPSSVTAVDNPAPDLKEVLGGYYLVEAVDDAQARALAELCPAPVRLHRAAADLGDRWRLIAGTPRRGRSGRGPAGPLGPRAGGDAAPGP